MVRKVKREHVLGKTRCIQMLEMFVNMKQLLVMSEVGRHWRVGCKTLGRKGQAPSCRYTFIEHLLCAVSSG